MKWADYCVTKLNIGENGLIESILFNNDLGDSLSNDEFEKNRAWMVQETAKGKTFCSIKKNDSGSWNNIGSFSYDGEVYSWFIIPKNITKRKTFISYYHKDDQGYREKFENLFGDLIVGKSVYDGDIDSDNSDAYIKQLIHRGHLADTTVLVVLIGPNTKCRMHVDWEISGALNLKVGGSNAGLLGILLPTHPDYASGKATYSLLPGRLADNFKSGYAIIRDWTDDRVKMQSYIEDVFSYRTSKADKRDNSRIQMVKNVCE